MLVCYALINAKGITTNGRKISVNSSISNCLFTSVYRMKSIVQSQKIRFKSENFTRLQEWKFDQIYTITTKCEIDFLYDDD